ncbi:MAG: bifunctional hydroxymethylpyrimidine kinase/phosphomethylpyrimidine kinase [Ignavibacteriales bacterium]|nr:bifunctional hydroxymethylpyrimidine kinase/phosphomethylpyrimidine kinase [Ignavibacteriales bacterium]MCB9259471.1 bifunctional hydroxymethylpyrimidine kinase/phosphomethylpyrimidine kinase [Ignavibacteriales bacterium]
MLDGYFWGNVARISPEAPVPVVEVENEFFRFGGAANVALNILSLGGIPITIGVIGNDLDGKTFLNLMKSGNLNSDGIIIDKNRPTTTKTRVIAGKQHVARIDKESKENISRKIEKKIIENLKAKINDIDAIILQDYNKGVLTENLIDEIIKLGNEDHKIISVDPKFINFKKYTNTTIFKPNRKETEDILGIRINTDEEISFAGNELLKILKPKYVLLTLGEKGLALFGNGDKEIRIPTKARKVSDVSGAGDTVISTITYALTAGAKIEEAAYIANYAAGLVCEEVGIVPIDRKKLFITLLNN